MDNSKVLKQINTDYSQFMESNSDIQQLYGKLARGRVAQTDALQFAKLSGSGLADMIVNNIDGELALDDALAIIPEALRTNHDYVTSYLMRLQARLDEKTKIGLKPLTAPFDADRAAGLAEEATASTPEVLKSQVENFSMHAVDESMKMTAESRSHAGLTVLVSRKYDDRGLSGGRVCEWCIERECSEIPYQEAYDMGVFERHPGCECLITYTNAKGETTYQAVGGTWYKSSDEALAQRKNHGL